MMNKACNQGDIASSCHSDSTVASSLPVLSILALGLQSKHHAKVTENRYRLISFLSDEDAP